MVGVSTKDYTITLSADEKSSWGYSYIFSLSETGDRPDRTVLVLPVACGLSSNWNDNAVVSVHQNDFVRVSANRSGVYDLRLAFIFRRTVI